MNHYFAVDIAHLTRIAHADAQNRLVPDLQAGRRHVREVHERGPVDAASAHRPVVVAVRQLHHQLVRDRRHKDAVVPRVNLVVASNFGRNFLATFAT